MVREGGKWSAGEKNEKGERKKEEIYIKKWEKALKMHLFAPAANFLVGEKN